MGGCDLLHRRLERIIVQMRVSGSGFRISVTEQCTDQRQAGTAAG